MDPLVLSDNQIQFVISSESFLKEVPLLYGEWKAEAITQVNKTVTERVPLRLEPCDDETKELYLQEYPEKYETVDIDDEVFLCLDEYA